MTQARLQRIKTSLDQTLTVRMAARRRKRISRQHPRRQTLRAANLKIQRITRVEREAKRAQIQARTAD